MKFVKCINCSDELILNKIYKVIRENNAYVTIKTHKKEGSWFKNRFVKVEFNEKIAKILYS